MRSTGEPLLGEALSEAIRGRMLAALAEATDPESQPAALRSTGDAGPGRPGHATAEAELERYVALQGDYPRRVGKTLRGRVLVLSAAAHGAGPDLADAITVAAALELFQAWVLIHDDIEDGSEQRRGAPALHRLVGVPVALNVGDALHARMWRLLHALVPGPDADALRAGRSAARARAILDEFGTMVTRTAAGQHLDLAWVAAGRFDVTEDEYLRMVTLKTAWYTVASPLRLGALVAGRTPDPRLTAAGLDLGAAFQVRDDVLNLAASEEAPGYGKEALGDLYEAKRTLILAHLLATVDPEEAAEVTGRLAKPREERTGEDVIAVLELMRKRGSVAYAQATADRLARRGLETLREALMELPSRTHAEALLRDLAVVAERTS